MVLERTSRHGISIKPKVGFESFPNDRNIQPFYSPSQRSSTSPISNFFATTSSLAVSPDSLTVFTFPSFAPSEVPTFSTCSPSLFSAWQPPHPPGDDEPSRQTTRNSKTQSTKHTPSSAPPSKYAYPWTSPTPPSPTVIFHKTSQSYTGGKHPPPTIDCTIIPPPRLVYSPNPANPSTNIVG